jgi:hypothetical protein
VPLDITAISAIDVHIHVHRPVRADQDQAGSANRRVESEAITAPSARNVQVPPAAR